MGLPKGNWALCTWEKHEQWNFCMATTATSPMKTNPYHTVPTPIHNNTVGKTLASLENWFCLSQTNPLIQEHILMRLKEWHKGETQGGPETRRFTQHPQDSLGWKQALEGMLAQQWQSQQEQYWKQKKSRKSNNR